MTKALSDGYSAETCAAAVRQGAALLKEIMAQPTPETREALLEERLARLCRLEREAFINVCFARLCGFVVAA